MKKNKIVILISMASIGLFLSANESQLRDLYEEEKLLIEQDNIIDYLNSLNRERSVDGVGTYINQSIESNTRIVEEIKNKLDRKYSNEDNYVQSKERMEENISSTGWIDSSAPYNCTSWSIVTGGDERRTCTVTQLKSETKHNRNTEFGLVKDINITFQEREVQITQYRSEVAPTERFLIDYNKDFAWGGGSNSNPGSGGSDDGQNGKTGEITATMTIPENLYIGYKFPISWSSTNAEYCNISLLSGANNGTEAVRKEIVLNTMGEKEVTLTCGNQTDEKVITKTIEVGKIKCPALTRIRGGVLYKSMTGTILGPTQSSYLMVDLPEQASGSVNKSVAIAEGRLSCGRYSYRINGRSYWAALDVRSASATYTCLDGVWVESNYKSTCRNRPYYDYKYEVLQQWRPTTRNLNTKTVPDYSMY